MWGEIGKVAPVKLSQAAFSCPLSLCSANNGFASYCSSRDHSQHCACTPRGTDSVTGYSVLHTCMGTAREGFAAVLGPHCCGITITFMRGHLMATLWSCYGCCISEERGCVLEAMPAGENKSLWGSCPSWSPLQPLNSSLVVPGFSEQ